MSVSSAPKGSRFVILAAMDGTAEGLEVAKYAADFAGRLSGVELHLLHCVSQLRADLQLSEVPAHMGDAKFVREGEEVLERATAETRHLFNGKLATHLTSGSPTREILQLANDLRADLIIVGTQDLRGPKRMLLGSVSEHVAKRARCPVVVVRKIRYAETEPEIEPPCEDCLAVQASSAGAQLWCERHSHHLRRIHTVHGANGPNVGGGSMFIRT